MTTPGALAADGAPRLGTRFGASAVTHVLATLLLLLEFVLLQAVAIGITTGVYLLIPALEAGAEQVFDDWRKIFQIVSPTIGISGGAGIVLSSIIYARQAQQAEARRQAAEAEAQAAKVEAQVAKAVAEERSLTIATLQAELSRIADRLDRLENGNGDA